MNPNRMHAKKLRQISVIAYDFLNLKKSTQRLQGNQQDFKN